MNLDGSVVQRKSTGGKLPRKQIARTGDFHKRVRETSGNSNTDSGARIKKIRLLIFPMFALEWAFQYITYFSSVSRKTK